MAAARVTRKHTGRYSDHVLVFLPVGFFLEESQKLVFGKARASNNVASVSIEIVTFCNYSLDAIIDLGEESSLGFVSLAHKGFLLWNVLLYFLLMLC